MTEPIKWRGHELAAVHDWLWTITTPGFMIEVCKEDDQFFARFAIEGMEKQCEAYGATALQALDWASNQVAHVALQIARDASQAINA